jgi:hypothetical protein
LRSPIVVKSAPTRKPVAAKANSGPRN